MAGVQPPAGKRYMVVANCGRPAASESEAVQMALALATKYDWLTFQVCEVKFEVTDPTGPVLGKGVA